MQLGIMLAIFGSLLGLAGPLLLPFIHVIEVDRNVPGWQTAPGVAAIALAAAAASAAALVARRRRLQSLGAVLGLLAMGEVLLMAWTWRDVWALVPCEDSGLALCDARTGTLVAETLVRLDWGVAAVLTGAIATFAGGLIVLLAHPEFGRDERFLRVRLGWQGGTLAEQVLFRPRPVTFGEGEGAMFVLPSAGIDLHGLLAPLGGDRWSLRAPPLGELELLRGSDIVALEAGDVVEIGGGDVGVLRLDDDLALSFDFMTAESAVLGGAAHSTWELLPALTGVVVLALLVLVGSALGRGRHDRRSVEEALAARKSALVEVTLAEPPAPELLPEAPALEPTTTAKRAEGEQGQVGDPDTALRRPSKLPAMDAALAAKVDVRQLGVAKVLGGVQAMDGALGAVLAGDSDRIADKLAVASAGDGVELELGHGPGGMGFRGTGSGGGDPRGVGRIRGLGPLDTGPGPGRRGDIGRAGKRARKVADLGPTTAVRAGELCDRGDIVKQVRRRAAALRACYEGALLHQPALAGKVTAQWTIGADGGAERAKITESTLGSAKVEDCVLRVLERLRFAAPEGGVCVVQWPFVFAPG